MMVTPAGQRERRDACPNLPADTEEADPAGLLHAALARIARLELAVAELLLKNEQLRQQMNQQTCHD